MTQTSCYVNGQLVDSQDAVISVFDHGFTVADGVFETLKFNSGQAFATSRHLRRLENSANGLGISCPPLDEIKHAIDLVSKANQHISNGRMRITVTSGQGPLGSDRSNSKSTLVISVAEQKPWPESSEVLIVPWIRNEKSPLVSLKTTSYAENVYALDVAHKNGFTEAVFLNSQGLVTEGTGSNIFIVKDGQVLTPGLSSGLLAGITRELLIEWAGTKFEVFEKDLFESDLYEADELFVTSSTRDVHPITRLAKLVESNQVIAPRTLKVGSITQELVEIFQAMSSEQINP